MRCRLGGKFQCKRQSRQDTNPARRATGMPNSGIENRKPPRFEANHEHRVPRRIEKQGLTAPFRIPLRSDIPQCGKTLLTGLRVRVCKQHVSVCAKIAICSIQLLRPLIRQMFRKCLDCLRIQRQFPAVLLRNVESPMEKCLCIRARGFGAGERRTVQPIKKPKRLILRYQAVHDDNRHSLNRAPPHLISRHRGIALPCHLASK